MSDVPTSYDSASAAQSVGPRINAYTGALEIDSAPTSSPSRDRSIGRSMLDQRQLRDMKVLSIVQIICGALSITLEIVLLLIYRGTVFYSGIWCGIFFLLSGTLGLVGAARNRWRLLAATVRLHILSSLLSILIVAFIGVFIDDCNGSMLRGVKRYCNDAEYALGGLLIVISIAELIGSIWSSVLCFKGLRGIDPKQEERVRSQANNNIEPAVYYGAQSSSVSQVTILRSTSDVATQPPVFMPAGYSNRNESYYPKQRLSAESKNDAA